MRARTTISTGTAEPGELATILRQNLRTGLPYIRSSYRFRGGERCTRIVSTHTTRHGRKVTTTTTFRRNDHALAWLAISQDHTQRQR